MRTAALPILISLCIASSAPASIVTFSNAGGAFQWSPRMFGIGHQPGNQLDVTQPATQSGTASPTGVGWTLEFPSTSSDGVTHDTYTGANVRVARSTVGIPVQLLLGLPPTTLFPTADFSDGTPIGPGLNWQSGTTLGYIYPQDGLGTHWIAGTILTMGVQLTLADGVHYGYARFALGSQYNPTEWGYEDQPGVPISVPAPSGALVLSVLGTLALRRRR